MTFDQNCSFSFWFFLVYLTKFSNYYFSKYSVTARLCTYYLLPYSILVLIKLKKTFSNKIFFKLYNFI